MVPKITTATIGQGHITTLFADVILVSRDVVDLVASTSVLYHCIDIAQPKGQDRVEMDRR